jgi:serine/threonine-protein kinase
MDFGLAKLMDDSENRRVTDTNIDFAVGTPGYIAPEQVRGETMNHRGDIYSVGVMLYELLTGRLPFQGANSMDVLLAHATEPPPRFADLGLMDWIPPGIEALVMQCLEKDPDDRPQSARELAENYAAVIHQAQSAMNTTTQPARASNPRRGPAVPSEDLVELESAPAPSTPPTVTYNPTELTPNSLFSRDPGSLPFQMEAWMPETIALMKLRGFVQDNGGEVLESALGMVRVRLGRGRTGWLGFGRRSVIELELRLHKINPKNENQLAIEVLFHPSHVALLADENWRNRCANIFVELRAYLMGGSML